MDRDRSGARGPGFASLIGREGLTYCFGAAGGFVGKRMGGLGGIGEIGVATGSSKAKRSCSAILARVASVDAHAMCPPCFFGDL